MLLAIVGSLTILLAVLLFQRLKLTLGFVPQGPFNLEYIKVITGNEFDIKLDNGQRIHAKLQITAVPEAKTQVIRLLNSSKNPQVIICGKKDEFWLVDIILTTDRNISLTEWLQSNKLSWDSY